MADLMRPLALVSAQSTLGSFKESPPEMTLAMKLASRKKEPNKCPPNPVAPTTTRNENMHVSQDVTVTEKTSLEKTREHFLDRLCDIRRDKMSEARLKFGFDQPPVPRTIKELVDRIKAGDYTLSDCLEDEDDYIEGYASPWDYIQWGKVKRDHKGYVASQDKLEHGYKLAKDSFWAEPDTTKYPKLLEKFESATFH